MAQISYPYMTIRKVKNIALTIQNFASKVMSLLFNMLSRFIIAFFQGVGSSLQVAKVLEHDSYFELPHNRTVEYIFICVWPLKCYVCEMHSYC